MNKINTIEELEALYGHVNANSLAKVSPDLTAAYQKLLEASPFCVVATTGPEGLDCSPRGDTSGFVHVLNRSTLALPDRRGNNRLDTLRNIVRCPRIALLFLIPGKNETLRINGTAYVTTDDKLRNQLRFEGKQPNSIVIIEIAEVYFQCARALIRSKLWDPTSRIESATLPTAGQMMQSVLHNFNAEQYDIDLPERQRDTLY